MAINVYFSKKEMLLKSGFEKVWLLNRELWWTRSPVVVFGNENQWETAEIPGWFSLGDFVIILKNFLLLFGEDALCKSTKCFSKQPYIKYCCFCKIF
jgi:hypothetical protein